MNKDKDMYLPAWVLGLGIMFFAAAIVCIVLAFTDSVSLLIGAAVFAGVGVAAVLCWKNQWVKMEDDDSFIYSTMFGNKKRYYFYEIKDLKRNADSLSLICEDGKIHIESCAIMTERFVDAVNSALARRFPENS